MSQSFSLSQIWLVAGWKLYQRHKGHKNSELLGRRTKKLRKLLQEDDKGENSLKRTRIEMKEMGVAQSSNSLKVDHCVFSLSDQGKERNCCQKAKKVTPD